MEDPNAELFPALTNLDRASVRAEMEELSASEIQKIKHGAYGVISIAEDLLWKKDAYTGESG